MPSSSSPARACAHQATVHQVHAPEIELTSPTTGNGVWALEDVIRFGPGVNLRGYGHYQETYQKVDGRWHIKSSKLTRLREDVFNGLVSVYISNRIRKVLIAPRAGWSSERRTRRHRSGDRRIRSGGQALRRDPARQGPEGRGTGPARGEVRRCSADAVRFDALRHARPGLHRSARRGGGARARRRATARRHRAPGGDPGACVLPQPGSGQEGQRRGALAISSRPRVRFPGRRSSSRPPAPRCTGRATRTVTRNGSRRRRPSTPSTSTARTRFWPRR